ncbi:hypothetical protein [Mesorhizobium muleiense]|uniref:hypothetical protein n=1 Tax=Mesorhizobium muleiense TaxID=1004279 RepID=UPI001F3D63A5|nr:hypothetical protein [Mesorhizobium muleiense]MCF6112002.1 hypothetical protein [Mesorhizobium muleiense]
MHIVLRMLLGAACIAVLAIAGIQIWTFLSPSPVAKVMNPTARQVQRCEEDLAAIAIRPKEQAYGEMEAKYYAVSVATCDEFGIVDSVRKAEIMRGQLGPYLDAYQKNPDVWRQPG